MLKTCELNSPNKCQNLFWSQICLCFKFLFSYHCPTSSTSNLIIEITRIHTDRQALGSTLETGQGDYEVRGNPNHKSHHRHPCDSGYSIHGTALERSAAVGIVHPWLEEASMHMQRASRLHTIKVTLSDTNYTSSTPDAGSFFKESACCGNVDEEAKNNCPMLYEPGLLLLEANEIGITN